MLLRRSVLASAGLLLASSFLAFAQEPQAPAPGSSDQVQKERPFGRRQRDGANRNRFGFGLEELNLTEQQKQQAHAILQRHLESTRAQREELFKLREKRTAQTLTAEDGERAKALHQQLSDSMQSVRAEINGILTPEQRTQLDQLEAQRKDRREEMLKRREDRNRVPRQ